MNELKNDGNPWSPVDESATTVETVTPEPPLEIKGGNVTAHINLGGDTSKEEEPPTEEEKANADKAAADDSDVEADTSGEVEDAEAALAEKLAALDAAKSGKTARKSKK